MNINISYDPYQHNWYVGELYKTFHQYLVDQKYNVNYIHIKDLAKKYDEFLEYNENNCPSVFSIYSLIIQYNDKSIVHNLSDYASTLPLHESAINKLNVKIFSFSSNLTKETIDKYKNNNFIIIPSFYILENLNDSYLIEKYRYNQKTKKICYFNGLLYGVRKQYQNVLNNSQWFNILDKSNNADFKTKENYFNELSEYYYGLSLNGAAKICYRDLEYFGVGLLCLREKLDIITLDPIIENYHYKTIIDEDIASKIYDKNQETYILNKINYQINSITDEEFKFITHNAYMWYKNNATLNSQIKLLNKLLLQLKEI